MCSSQRPRSKKNNIGSQVRRVSRLVLLCVLIIPLQCLIICLMVTRFTRTGFIAVGNDTRINV